MSIPDYETLMLPLLEACRDGAETSMSELRTILADQLKLNDEQRDRRLPSGQATVIASRVGWAKTYLKFAGLLEQPRRGWVRITAEGRGALDRRPERLTAEELKRYPSFVEFLNRTRPDDEPAPVGSGDPAPPTKVDDGRTPIEVMEESFAQLEKATAAELLERLMGSSPAFFEKVVVKLLLAMGYGGATGDGLATGKSGDGGIDGVIREDKLGLDIVSVQAKRWEGCVGRPVVQAFVGSMDFIRSRKGVIITTSTFSREAREYVDRIEGKKVVLIDGQQLARFMLDHNLGVATTRRYEVKEISQDFFSDDLE